MIKIHGKTIQDREKWLKPGILRSTRTRMAMNDRNQTPLRAFILMTRYAYSFALPIVFAIMLCSSDTTSAMTDYSAHKNNVMRQDKAEEVVVDFKYDIAQAEKNNPETDTEAVISELKRRAANGDDDALFALGVLYQYNPDVIDPATAASWYKKAADSGSAKAINSLGLLYRNGIGVPKNESASCDLFKKASDLGYVPAMINLGECLVMNDDHEAARLFKRGAEEGYSGANLNLGVMYYTGRGVNQDFGKALELFKTAAAQGECYAYLNVGGSYFNGLGIPQDRNLAYEWFDKAQICNGGFDAKLEQLAMMWKEKALHGKLPRQQKTQTISSSTKDMIIGGLALALALAVIMDNQDTQSDGQTLEDWEIIKKNREERERLAREAQRPVEEAWNRILLFGPNNY